MIRDISSMIGYISLEEDVYTLDEELNHRLRLYAVVKKINEEIDRILNEDTSKESEENQDNSFENPPLLFSESARSRHFDLLKPPGYTNPV